jgi:hypothetical protein
MAPSVVHLPDGQNFTVQPVFSGLFFKSNELNTHPTPFPAGWTVVLHSEDGPGDDEGGEANEPRSRRSHIHKYSRPTLQNDTVFISSISNPSNNDFKPAASASRQIALMVYVTLYWYFQQPAPEPYLDTPQSQLTPAAARPKGEWRIRVKRDGVLRTRNMIPKLERMGLLTTLDTAVGTSLAEDREGWNHMFVSRRMFWQIPTGLFLFTLQPTKHGASSYPGSPAGSRPASPVRGESPQKHLSASSNASNRLSLDRAASPTQSLSAAFGAPLYPTGPYFSPSGLPTYYPPAPLQYTVTSNIRHPLRPKPPRMGEVFYTRFVPSVGRYLSFRVASLSPKPVPGTAPVSGAEREHAHLCTLSDTSLLQMWMANPRVAAFWGDYHPTFLSAALQSRHSFPAIAMWDGVPFGYFEIYWVKEDALGRHLGAEADDFDRGMHLFVGEEWARGRMPYWMSGLVHWCWQADNRTMSVLLEPRIDNEKFIQRLQDVGFSKDQEIPFPHKQAVLCRIRREFWDGPAL